ncbi:hypothetical protein J6590_086469 [Homalodisca vitripennis]|nr:hypothetical protein J6590_086469 [Homalodisca vitripennis]
MKPSKSLHDTCYIYQGCLQHWGEHQFLLCDIAACHLCLARRLKVKLRAVLLHNVPAQEVSRMICATRTVDHVLDSNFLTLAPASSSEGISARITELMSSACTGPVPSILEHNEGVRKAPHLHYEDVDDLRLRSVAITVLDVSEIVRMLEHAVCCGSPGIFPAAVPELATESAT